MSETVVQNARRTIPRRLRRICPGLLAIFVVLGLIAPLINAARFSAPIQRHLEAWLGRELKFDSVHFTLFSGPGFSLQNVIIGEDPRYGLEPFAYVPTLEARLRLDKLFMGHMAFSSIRLVEPSLNLVKRNDGTWNVVTLMDRLVTPERSSLNLFPAFEVSSGRIDFKFGTRKTVLYMLDSDLTVNPARFRKFQFQFSGSPARTDRAGNGFGHLRGGATVSLDPGNSRNRLVADITLDPSNLSELTTLIQGHDIGVHGTISSRAHVEGPVAALRIYGELRVDDVHRWDLLPSSGESWRIRYQGTADLLVHRLDLRTVQNESETSPVALAMHLEKFLAQPLFSVAAQFNNAPIENLLPLGRRMGLSLPRGLIMTGSLDGAIADATRTGLTGHVAIHHATATLSHTPVLRAPVLEATISSDRVHLEPAEIQTDEGTVEVSGDYFSETSRMAASLGVVGFPVDAFKSTIDAWFGSPPALAALNGGDLTGSFSYTPEDTHPDLWSGQFSFSNASVSVPGIAVPLSNARGRVSFDQRTFNLDRFVSTLGDTELHGSYRYSPVAKRPERVHVEAPSADLEQIERALAPAFEPQGLLARLRLSRRTIPAWLAARNIDGDISIGEFSAGHTNLGPLSARFRWQGTKLQFTTLQLNLPEGLVRAQGSVSVASYFPRYRFSGKITGFPWRGGLLNAEGDLESAGTGMDVLQNLRARGTFTAGNVMLSADDDFQKLAGSFELSFADGWPNLHLSDIEASDGEDAWNGTAVSQSDGKLIFDLENAGRQRRVVTSLAPETGTAISDVLNGVFYRVFAARR